MEKVNGQHDRHDATDALVRLRETPAGQDMECIIEAFVVIMYDRTTTTFAVNKARFEMFSLKQRQYDAILPTRSAYQGGHVWGQSLNFSQDIPSPEDWGKQWEQMNVIGHQTGQHFRRLQRLARIC